MPGHGLPSPLPRSLLGMQAPAGVNVAKLSLLALNFPPRHLASEATVPVLFVSDNHHHTLDLSSMG
jgi:hypothetical protein